MDYKINTRTFLNALTLQLENSLNVELNKKIKLRIKSIPFSDVTSWFYLDLKEDRDFLSFIYNQKRLKYPFVIKMKHS